MDITQHNVGDYSILYILYNYYITKYIQNNSNPVSICKQTKTFCQLTMVTFLANRKVMKNKNKCEVVSVFPVLLKNALSTNLALGSPNWFKLHFLQRWTLKVCNLELCCCYNNFKVTLFRQCAACLYIPQC